jgi:hypothetical protein
MRAITFLLSAMLLCVAYTVRAAEPTATEQPVASPAQEPAVTNQPPVAPGPPVTKEQALAAIAMLETNAASNPGIQAAATILRFAQENNAVTVRLDPLRIPWARSKALEQEVAYRILLLGAYVAGSAKGQLSPQKTGDDPYEGWAFTIDVYHQIQKKKPEVVVPEIDALAEKQQKGELKVYAAEVQSKTPKP